ncbi:unnamed protein product [Scytosiphon promiscuus]
MREQHALLAGLVAVCTVSAAAFVRLVAVARIFRRQRQQQRRQSYPNGNSNLLLAHGTTNEDRVASSRVLVPSLLFHALLFLCLVVEVPVYACRWLSACGILDFVKEGRQLYALHMASYLLLFMAFSVVVTLWNDVAVFEPNDWTTLMNRSMVVLCLCYVVVTAVAACVCLGLGSTKYFLSSGAFLLFCAYSIAVLLLLGLSFLVLGCLLQRRICRVLVTGSCTARLTARMVRLNVVMLACFICFTLRALMLAALVQAQADGEYSGNFSKGWKRWERDMRVEWALHVIPCVAMLYLMRKAGKPTPSSSSSQSPSAAAAAAAASEDGISHKRGNGIDGSVDERTGFAGGSAEEGRGRGGGGVGAQHDGSINSQRGLMAGSNNYASYGSGGGGGSSGS